MERRNGEQVTEGACVEAKVERGVVEPCGAGGKVWLLVGGFTLGAGVFIDDRMVVAPLAALHPYRVRSASGA